VGTETTNLSLYKPTAGETGWDDEVNANFDTLDTRLNFSDAPIMYVDPLKSNDNDGLTPGTAKKHVTAAYDALGSGGGTIRVISSTTANEIAFFDPLGTEMGLWIVGNNDSRYASIPSNGPDGDGFRRQKPLVLEGWGSREFYGDATGNSTPLTYIAGGSATNPLIPALWISGTNKPITVRGIRCVNLAQTVKLGIDTVDGTTNTNTSGVHFEGCLFTSNSTAANAATTQAAVKAGYTFWITFERCTFGAANAFLDVTSVALDTGTTYTYTTSVAHGLEVEDWVDLITFTPSGYNGFYEVTAVPSSTTFKVDIGSNPAAVSVLGDARHLRSDRRAGVLLGLEAGDANPGTVKFKDCVFNGSAGVRYRPLGATSWTHVAMEDCVIEGDFSNYTAPVFDMPAPSSSIPFYTDESSGYLYFRNCYIADGTAAAGVINLEGLKQPYLATAINCGHVQGPHISVGSGTSLLRDGDIVGTIRSSGEPRRLYGEHQGHRRAFHPTAARYANNVQENETLWTAGSGTASVTTGQTAPDGTTRAGLLTSASGTDYRRIGGIVTTVSVGDFVIAGGWYRSSTSTWPPTSSFTPLQMGCSSTSVDFDTAQVSTNEVPFGTQYLRGRDRDGDWQFATVAHQVVATTGGSHTIFLDVRAYAGYPFYHYGGMLLYIPVADGLTYAEVRSMRDGLASYAQSLSVGEVGTMLGQTFNSVGPMKLQGVKIQAGTGSPEGSLTAPIGSMYLRKDGGASTTLYIKTSGTGNTGWTAK
jgi:hypothetical protein